MIERIHVIDPDIGRRAQVSRELSSLRMNAEIYEDLEEFRRLKPDNGFVFAADGGETCDPFDLMDVLRTNGSLLPVVMYADQPDTECVVNAMRSGVLDYLQWPFDHRRLDSAFQRLEIDGIRMRQGEQLMSAAKAKIEKLTAREREVLILLIQGMSNKVVAKTLGISPRTVEIHRGHMMVKLNAQSAADAVRIGLYAGLDEDFRFAAQ
jgi:two-component system, LuxR family, response regulator FixJ